MAMNKIERKDSFLLGPYISGAIAKSAGSLDWAAAYSSFARNAFCSRNPISVRKSLVQVSGGSGFNPLFSLYSPVVFSIYSRTASDPGDWVPAFGSQLKKGNINIPANSGIRNYLLMWACLRSSKWGECLEKMMMCAGVSSTLASLLLMGFIHWRSVIESTTKWIDTEYTRGPMQIGLATANSLGLKVPSAQPGADYPNQVAYITHYADCCLELVKRKLEAQIIKDQPGPNYRMNYMFHRDIDRYYNVSIDPAGGKSSVWKIPYWMWSVISPARMLSWVWQNAKSADELSSSNPNLAHEMLISDELFSLGFLSSIVGYPKYLDPFLWKAWSSNRPRTFSSGAQMRQYVSFSMPDNSRDASKSSLALRQAQETVTSVDWWNVLDGVADVAQFALDSVVL